MMGTFNVSEDDAVYVDGLCGVTAGLVETIGTHPFDTLRAQIMTGASKHNSIVPAFKSLVRREGVRALWRGLYPSLCQTTWSSAVFAVSYEFIKRSANTNSGVIGFGDDE